MKDQKAYKILSWSLLAIILLVGGTLRFCGLEKESLWADELESWRISAVSNFDEVITSCKKDVHPPGYQAFLWIWMKTAGDSPAMLRLPSALAGVFSILLLFLIGKDWFSKKEGLIAAGILAVSWFGVYYSQEARAYAFLLLFTLISHYAWFRLFRPDETNQKRIFPAILFIVSGILGIYFHYFMALILFTQFLLTFLLFFRNDPKKTLLRISSFGAIGLGFLIWVPQVIKNLNISAFWIPSPGWSFYPEFFRKATLYQPWIALSFFLLILVLWFIPEKWIQKIVPSVSINPEPKKNKNWLIVLLWAFLPFLIAFVKSRISTPVLTMQNMIITLPALYLLLAGAFSRIQLPKKLNLLAGGGFVLMLLVYLLGVKNYYQTTEKMQYREAANWAFSESPAPSSTLFLTYDYYPAYFGYYLREHGVTPEGTGGEIDEFPSIKAHISQSGKSHFCYLSGKFKPEPEFLEALSRDFPLVKEKALFEVEARLFQIPN